MTFRRPLQNNVNNPNFVLFNTRNPLGGGTWQPCPPATPDGALNPDGGSWWVNPFYPATPIDLISNDQINMYLEIDQAPSQYASAMQNVSYVAPFLTTFPSFHQQYGYFEIQCAIPQVNGTRATFSLMLEDGVSQEPIINIIDVFAPGGGQYLLNMSVVDVGNVRYDYFDYTWDATNIHTYGIDWQSDVCSFYVDRVRVATYATPASLVGVFANVVLAYGVGSVGSWPGAPDATSRFPAVWQIGYVKGWSIYPF